jgi:hypothetical protein
VRAVMLQDYAFFAMFTVQILAMSIVHPAWLVRYARKQAMTATVQRLEQLHQGVDIDASRERFVAIYRAVNTVIAVLGALLLSAMISYPRPNVRDDAAGLYFVLQVSPLLVVAVMGLRYSKRLQRVAREPKRKAVLQRRGLFDFVSPFTVGLAVLSYFLFVAFVIYIQQNPFPGFAGYTNIVIITVLYTCEGFVVYKLLYGRKFSPFEPHAFHVRGIGTGVKACVYSCIMCVVFISLSFSLALLELRGWKPFATSFFLVLFAALGVRGFMTPPREPGDGAGAGQERLVG